MSTPRRLPPLARAALITLVAAAAVAGCAPKGQGDGADTQLHSGDLGEPQSPFGRLVFEELYYAGAKPLGQSGFRQSAFRRLGQNRRLNRRKPSFTQFLQNGLGRASQRIVI